MLPVEKNPLYLIEVIKRPEGPAPDYVRDSWVGTVLVAMKKPPLINEVDPVSNRTIIGRKSFLVDRQQAMEVLLRQGRYEAVNWFEQNFPSNINALSFSAREIKVLAEAVEKKPFGDN